MNHAALKKLRDALAKKKYKCKEGCFECCTLVPVLPEEIPMMRKELLRNGFQEPPNGKGDGYCEFLTTEGKCSVYNQRPMICRSFDDTKYIMKAKGRSIPTQHCTYGDGHEETASPDFMKYGSEVYNRGVVIGSKDLLDKISEKKTPIPFL